MLGKINALIKQNGFGKDTLLRLTLEGSLAGHLDISSIGIESITSGLYYCELRDHTSPDYDLEALRGDPTIKGELVRTLTPLLESEDENHRILAARALKYALSALAGNDISDFN